jgi:transposase
MANEFWLSDEAWAAIEPLIPMCRRGVKPGNNRKVISGVVHVLRTGCRWRDCPEVFGPHTTIYNRFNRWSRDGIWQSMWERLIQLNATKVQCIDSTSSKAHRCAAGGEGGEATQDIGRSRGGRTTKMHAVVDARGRMIAFDLTPGQRGDILPAKAVLEPLPAPAFLLADTAYDGDKFRDFLSKRGTTPVIRPNPTRKNVPEFDKSRYKDRNVIERAFCRIKDWRRVATRYDKLARNFRSTVLLAAIFIWWT